MPVVVSCPGCQTRLTLDDGRVGTTMHCPRCRLTITIPSPVPPPLPPSVLTKTVPPYDQVVDTQIPVDADEDLLDGLSLELQLGEVESTCGHLSFKFVVSSNGDAYIQVYGSDPSDRRKAGVLLTLDGDEYRKLKSVIDKAERTIAKLKGAGRMRRMRVFYD